MDEVINFFKNRWNNIGVINVEKDMVYQERGIDFLYQVDDENGLSFNTVEVKTIRYPEKYYFIETISNTNKNTLGSFLTCQADYIVFYFIYCKRLHKIRTCDFILWFLRNQNEFETKETITKDDRGNVLYTTVGKLVPCNRVIEELDVQILALDLNNKNSNSRYNNQIH